MGYERAPGALIAMKRVERDRVQRGTGVDGAEGARRTSGLMRCRTRLGPAATSTRSRVRTPRSRSWGRRNGGMGRAARVAPPARYPTAAVDRRQAGDIKERAGRCDVLGAVRVGEEPIVADAVEAVRQHVQMKAADELVQVKPHCRPAVRPVDAIVLPAERDAGVVGCDEAAVGDGDTVRVKGKIAQDLLRSRERRLAINHSLDAPQRGRKPLNVVLSASPACGLKSQLAGVVRIGEHRQHLPLKRRASRLTCTRTSERQQLRFAVGQPSARGRGLALRPMPVTARIVGDQRMAARRVLAARDMASERGSAAALDRAHHLQLIEAHMAAVGRAPSGTVVAEDVRDLQSWSSQSTAIAPPALCCVASEASGAAGSDARAGSRPWR